MERRNTLSFPNFDTNTIGSARQAASSALSSAFNTVVAQPVTSLKNNISSTVNSSINSSSSSSSSSSNSGGGGNSSGKTGPVESIDVSNEEAFEFVSFLTDSRKNFILKLLFLIRKTFLLENKICRTKRQTNFYKCLNQKRQSTQHLLHFLPAPKFEKLA